MRQGDCGEGWEGNVAAKNDVEMVYNICYMDFTEILEPANPHKHWGCKNFLKILALTS